MTDTIQHQLTTPGDQDLLGLVHSLPYGDPRRDEACTTLISRHGWIVRTCVHRYPGYPEPEELMQVGYLGLLKAINNFDPARGGDLAAYAWPCVSGEIKRHFRDKRWMVRVHRHDQELRLAIRDAEPELAQRLGRASRDSELAEYLGVPDSDISAARIASQTFQVTSLDAPAVAEDGDSDSLSDLIGCEDPRLEQTLDMAAVWKHCGELPVRQQRMLMMRFYGNMSQSQIAEELGISQMHVSRLLSQALSFLRRKISGTGQPGTQE